MLGGLCPYTSQFPQLQHAIHDARHNLYKHTLPTCPVLATLNESALCQLWLLHTAWPAWLHLLPWCLWHTWAPG
jgi:hypothetical protein